MVFESIFCHINIVRASTDNVESRVCLYTDVPGWLGLKTGIQDLAFMGLANTRPEFAFGLNIWHWYYDDHEKYYRTVVRATGSVPSAFHAWEVNFTPDLIIPFSYMHVQWPPWKGLCLLKQANSLSFSGWVFGVSPGIVKYVPVDTGYHVDAFRTLSPYFGLQVMAAKHFYIGARMGHQWAWHWGKESFVDRIENRYFASLVLGGAWK
jgi:hypothetical protein